MEWKNTAFKFRETAELCKKELDEAGIRTDFYIIGDGYYYIGWCPVGRAQTQKAIEIVTSHID